MRTLRVLFLSSFICLILNSQASAFEINEAAFEMLQKNMMELQKSVQGLQSTIQSQNEVIREQTIRIDGLERGQTQIAPQPGAVAMPSAAPKVAGISQGFNPDIGVTGTVQTKLTQDSTEGEGNDAIALKELELNFAHVVDPYSRLDAIISFNDNIEAQNVDIEEAYYTRWELPLGFTTQLGKFRSKIGKQNLMHLHQLDTTDYPLVIRDFFGEEGLASSGVRLQNMIPNPMDIPLEITGEVMRGNNGPSFSGISRRPIFNTHLKSYFDITKDANLEIGGTTLFGDENPPKTIIDEVDGTASSYTDPKGSDHYGVKVYGADATINWFLPEGKKIKWQNEVYFQNRSNLVHINNNPWGFYSLVDYKFSPRFSTGIRFDYLEPLDVIGQHNQDMGISPYLTFWQSEFADFKLQYSHFESANADAKSDNAIYLQADFLIGAHKHPVQ